MTERCRRYYITTNYSRDSLKDCTTSDFVGIQSQPKPNLKSIDFYSERGGKPKFHIRLDRNYMFRIFALLNDRGGFLSITLRSFFLDRNCQMRRKIHTKGILV